MSDTQLKAGPELDAAVAKAMGWEDVRIEHIGTEAIPIGRVNGVTQSVRPWSTCIAAAWTLLEEMGIGPYIEMVPRIARGRTANVASGVGYREFIQGRHRSRSHLPRVFELEGVTR